MGKFEKTWIDLFRHVTKRRPVDLERDLSNKRVGVDMDTWMYDNKDYFVSCIVAMGHQRKTYKPKLLMNTIQIRHDQFLRMDIEPIYVFRGCENPAKIMKKEEESKKKLLHDFYLTTLYDQPLIQRRSRWQHMQARYMLGGRLADQKLPRFLAEWMKSEGMKVVGAPMETAWQLVAMEQEGTIDAILSTSATVAAAGANFMLLGCRLGLVGTLEARMYKRDRDLTGDPHRFDLTGRAGELFPEAYTLLGSDYFKRIDNVNMRTVMKDYFPRYVKAQEEGRNFWIDEMKRTPEWAHAYDLAVAQLRYGPVMRPTLTETAAKTPSSTLQPLTPLPEGKQWPEVLGYNPIETLPIPIGDHDKAFNFQDSKTFGKEFNVLHPWFDELSPSHDEDIYKPADLLEYYVDLEDEKDPEVLLDAKDDWSAWRHVSPPSDR